MLDEITPEDAIRIAEWLNIKVDWVNGKPKILGPSGRWFLLEWLSSPEGELEIMNKLDELYYYQTSFKCQNETVIKFRGGEFAYELIGNSKNHRAGGKTRNQALKLVILGMLKNGDRKDALPS